MPYMGVLMEALQKGDAKNEYFGSDLLDEGRRRTLEAELARNGVGHVRGQLYDIDFVTLVHLKADGCNAVTTHLSKSQAIAEAYIALMRKQPGFEAYAGKTAFIRSMRYGEENAYRPVFTRFSNDPP